MTSQKTYSGLISLREIHDEPTVRKLLSTLLLSQEITIQIIVYCQNCFSFSASLLKPIPDFPGLLCKISQFNSIELSPGEVLLGIFGGGVSPASPNPDPILS